MRQYEADFMKQTIGFISLILCIKVSFAASFNCDMAKASVEKAICHSESISMLDENMASLYASHIKAYGDPKAIKSSQKIWLNTRNDCKDAIV
jgi:uncharacterized protein